MISHRTLAIIATICVPLLLMALAVKVSKSLETPFTALSHDIPSHTSLSPSSSFYEMDTDDSIVTKVVSSVSQGPIVTATAYIVGNVATGKIYISKNALVVLPVASMSKLITAIAATDTLSSTTMIEITPEETSVASDTSQLAAGEKFTVKELLYPLLLNSSNVAAEALASSSDRTKFLELMTSYSWEVGMPTTYFADPTGIDPHNQSTARDFFALARYLYGSRPDILAITRTPHMHISTTTDHGAHDFTSIHPFIFDPNFIGGKTGHTPQARDTLLTMMTINNQPIAIVIIASDGRERDTRILIDRVGKILAQ